MPLDLYRTVRPDSGLVRDLAVMPPNGTTHLLWSVVADIGQGAFSGARLTEGDYPLDLVGACGAQRAEAFVRACGEAVERAALLPVSALPDDPAVRPLDRGALWAPDAPGSPSCTAVDLATGEPRRVPVAAVDYPVPDPEVLGAFDPTPSGAAAGPTHEVATAAALRELAERDAAMVAWARQARLPALDLHALAASDDPAAAPLAALLDAARRAGLQPRAGLAPTAVPGAGCVIAAVLDRDGGVAAAGLAVCDRTPDAAVKAVQEALQVRTVLLGVAGVHAGTQQPVRTDLDRARWWARPEAIGAMERWLDGFGDPPATARITARGPDDPPDWTRAVPGAAVVDLTPRLPAAIRALGWHAVKALSPGAQPLRMSEDHAWSWHPDRLALPERAWAIRCAGEVTGVPHPFI